MNGLCPVQSTLFWFFFGSILNQIKKQQNEKRLMEEYDRERLKREEKIKESQEKDQAIKTAIETNNYKLFKKEIELISKIN